MDAGNDQFVRVDVSVHINVVVGLTNGKKGKVLLAVPSLREALKNVTAVVITGGSSGIGKSFIEHLAKLKPELLVCNLSRRYPDMAGKELKLRHIPCDLSIGAQVAAAVDAVLILLNREAPDGRVLLINNSGFGTYGCFLESEMRDQLEMVDVNIRSWVELTGRLLPTLVARGGGLINIASTAAFQPTPQLAVYGATKAFVLHWTLALADELRGKKVRVLAVCPGATKTGFASRAGMGQQEVFSSRGQTSDQVAREALEAWAGGRSLVVNGWSNALLARLGGCVPKAWAARVAGIILRRGAGKT